MPYVKLDGDYPDDPKIIKAGEQAELLFIRMLALCARTMSDGVVDDAQLARFALRSVKKRAEKLREVGLIEAVPGGYRVVAWLKHNASAKQIAQNRDKRSGQGSHANHLRWHVQKGAPNAACEWCQESSDNDESTPAGESLDRSQRDPSTDPGRESIAPPPTPDASIPPPPAPPLDRSAVVDDVDDPRLSAVVEAYADRATRSPGVEKPGPYRARVSTNLTLNRGGELRRYLREHPSERAEQVVDWLERTESANNGGSSGYTGNGRAVRDPDPYGRYRQDQCV